MKKTDKKTLGERVIKLFGFLCGVDNRKINRNVFWTMLSTISTIILLILAFCQLKGVNETTAAEFSHKIKNDLYTQENIKLISLFDDNVLIFKFDSSNSVWFELDTCNYKMLPHINKTEGILCKYNIFEIDELLQEFEDLSFYEKKGQISLDYIYDAYAYYIEMLWQNPEIVKYIKWQRNQQHNSNSYINLEHMYNKLRRMTDKED